MKKEDNLSYIFIFLVILICYLIRSIEKDEFPSKINLNCNKNINFFECKMAIKEKVPINRLSTYELELIPGVSSGLSKKIIDYQSKIKKIEDLKNIRGIGEKTFKKISKYLKVEKKRTHFSY